MQKSNNQRSRLIIALMLLCLLLPSCSSRGVHMSKHRKSRHCNCPTFSWNASVPTDYGSSIDCGDDRIEDTVFCY
ncbi:MAG: hypothetical protein IJR26_04505 [Bacteroidales bacterium]|nr:hypothetical protein [Bacteroidales bacterium]